jgi:hypothetical protein
MKTSRLKFAAIFMMLFALVAFSSNVSAQVKDTKQTQHGPRFVDANGDGICDNMIDANKDGIPDQRQGKGLGPKDGTGNKKGFGKGKGNCGETGSHKYGTGVCDGTGPKGKQGGK